MQYAQRDVVLAGELDRTDLQDLGTEAGHFQHLFEGDLVQTLSLGHDARIGGVDAIDVGVDLAFVSFQRCRQCNAGGVGASATQRGDVAVFIDALEPGDYHHTPFFQVGANFLIVDLQNTRLVVRAVSQNANLIAGIGHRRYTALDQCHGQQGNGDLLASGNDHVQFARNRLIADLFGQVDQAIGLAAHGGQNHHQIITRFAEFFDFVGHLLDALDRAHGGASKFLYD